MSKHTIHSQNNSTILARIWGDLVDWDERRKKDKDFLLGELVELNNPRIYDVALGDGCDSIFLIKSGFNVTSNELDPEFKKVAQLNAKKENVSLKITSLDWRDFRSNLPNERFDVVLCLGNSFSYLPNKRDRERVLREFYRITADGGKLIIDERNFKQIMDEKENLISNNGIYLSNEFVYCGKSVRVRPLKIMKRKLIVEYSHPNHGVGYILMHPLKEGELLALLRGTGYGNIEQFSDYTKGKFLGADFYQYVCHKE